MKKFLITLAAAATFLGGAFAIAVWSPIGTAGAEETNLKHHPGLHQRDGMKADRGEHFASIAEVLGVEVEDLRAQLAEGATMAEIAGDNVDVLIAALVDDATEKINEAVAAEKMTQEEADEWARKELINWKRKDKRWRKENLFVVMWQGINKDQTEIG